jgi:hypothetical protein
MSVPAMRGEFDYSALRAGLLRLRRDDEKKGETNRETEAT